MPSIYAKKLKSGETHYRVLLRPKGFRPVSRTFRRRTDAVKWAHETESAMRGGRFADSDRHRWRTVGDAITQYEVQVLPRRPLGARYKRVHLKLWRRELGHVLLTALTPAVVAEVRNRLVGEPTQQGPRTAATVNRYATSLSHVLSVAVREWGWLRENPLRRVDRLPEPRGRVRFLSDDERAALLAACRRSTETRLYVLTVMALSTGARQGEMLNLRWCDLDLDRGVAYILESKNGEARPLPIVGHCRELLLERGRFLRNSRDFVFPDGHGNTSFPQRAWRRALREAEIADFRFHDLRHSAASYLAMSGATLAEIAGVLGHKTLAMVKRYSHLSADHLTGVVGRMNNKIFGG